MIRVKGKNIVQVTSPNSGHTAALKFTFVKLRMSASHYMPSA